MLLVTSVIRHGSNDSGIEFGNHTIYPRCLSDDAVNLTSEKHDPNAQMNHLHKRRKPKDLAEGTSVVPAKYPPKVKLEIFSQL